MNEMLKSKLKSNVPMPISTRLNLLFKRRKVLCKALRRSISMRFVLCQSRLRRFAGLWKLFVQCCLENQPSKTGKQFARWLVMICLFLGGFFVQYGLLFLKTFANVIGCFSRLCDSRRSIRLEEHYARRSPHGRE